MAAILRRYDDYNKLQNQHVWLKILNSQIYDTPNAHFLLYYYALILVKTMVPRFPLDLADFCLQ